MKKIVAGVDEVGRGSLIGPVCAAAVIFLSLIHISEPTRPERLAEGVLCV